MICNLDKDLDQWVHYYKWEKQSQGSARLDFSSATMWQEEAGAQNPASSLSLKFRKGLITV